ncbi:hypothetical protein LTR62_000917 [Meristemomyces frigidus]|uniref:Repressor of RNA polymerase III transcription MAF1 n=1 Tax=Meristemomyces frigidus TaxID=1508187 RepID=A0AAN7TCL6_9PEZI|nr:hypothetical protein LTR62_000917 [Meristemomyces frigidus]
MKYLPVRDIDEVTNALNFSTSDCHVIGGCDIYTTKAAGSDKKLYKNIEHSLESQYESLVRLSASLSPPYHSAGSDDGKPSSEKGISHRNKRSRTVEAPEIDLSRASPFGPLSQINARRTFAYLIATLNASHPDYDFSHLLRPTDFRKERSLRSMIQTVDSTLQNLRPKSSRTFYLAPPILSHSAPIIANSAGSELWSPRMWTLIDREMGLRQCEKYAYVPDDDPFEGASGDGGSLWSMHYFFFNKEKKRVCYLHLRGLSVISHSPVIASRPSSSCRNGLKSVVAVGGGRRSALSVGEGASKRASYWLGQGVVLDESEGAAAADDDDDDDDDDDEEMNLGGFDDDEVEVPYMDLDEIRTGLAADAYYGYDEAVDQQDYAFEEAWELASRPRVRGMSEEIGEMIDLS